VWRDRKKWWRGPTSGRSPYDPDTTGKAAKILRAHQRAVAAKIKKENRQFYLFCQWSPFLTRDSQSLDSSRKDRECAYVWQIEIINDARTCMLHFLGRKADYHGEIPRARKIHFLAQRFLKSSSTNLFIKNSIVKWSMFALQTCEHKLADSDRHKLYTALFQWWKHVTS
jgi:hypothetical protein